VGSSFYDPGEKRAAKVQALFDAIAPRYDRINDLQSFGLHRLWKRRLIRLARLQPGERALDLCCGTGDITRQAARQGAQAIGLDFSAPMLQRALQRSTSSSCSYVRGDALRLPFPDQRFDVVTVGYGLRNLTRFDAALAEMRRVTRPRGRLLILDFGKPANAFWRALYFAYLKAVVPLYGQIFCGNAQAYAYILESLQHYPAQQGIAELMRQLGYAPVRIINLVGGVMSIHYGERQD
jgi:demethylmenaquinone methyltransferase/2-methoxy-6-polyprenyl-1,4-benzoquinol methylase